MKFPFVTLGLALTSSAFANLHLAPPDFDSSYGRAIFVDFKEAQYEINYDIQRKATIVKSKITFTAEKKGKPLFDLIPKPTKVTLNGQKDRKSVV